MDAVTTSLPPAGDLSPDSVTQLLGLLAEVLSHITSAAVVVEEEEEEDEVRLWSTVGTVQHHHVLLSSPDGSE